MWPVSTRKPATVELRVDVPLMKDAWLLALFTKQKLHLQALKNRRFTSVSRIGVIYLWNVFTAEGNTYAKRGHNTWPVGETYLVQMSGSCTKKASKCPGGGGGEVWRMIRLIRKTNLPIFVLIFHNDISQCFYCSFYLHWDTHIWCVNNSMICWWGSGPIQNKLLPLNIVCKEET